MGLPDSCAQPHLWEQSAFFDQPMDAEPRSWIAPKNCPARRRVMSTRLEPAGIFRLGDLAVNRLGYGAMQLAGPGVFGPPKDPEAAVALLREAIAGGVNHIDTSDYYGPHVTNQLIRAALHPYPDDLVIVSKIGARR